MKLEIKHLASYLEHKVVLSYIDCLTKRKRNAFLSGISNKEIETTYLRKIRGCSGDYISWNGNNNINDLQVKPILFPLSSLTKEITINGETFVPIKKLFELHHCGMRLDERLRCFSLNKNKIKYDDFNCAITDGVNMFGYSNYGGFQAIDTDEYRDYTVINQLELSTKLFEWKIDIFQLIDKNLAEPVTEDFNPYK